MRYLCAILAALGIMVHAQTPQPQSESVTYFSTGLADGAGKATIVLAFNPSDTETVTLTLTALNNSGQPLAVLPQEAQPGIMTDTLQISLPPLASYFLETGKVATGEDVGSLDVVANGELAIWQQKTTHHQAQLTGQQTLRFQKGTDTFLEYFFPYAAETASEGLVRDWTDSMQGSSTQTVLFARNTKSNLLRIRFSARDALLGTDLGFYDLDVDKKQTGSIFLDQAFPGLTHASISITAQILEGEGFPFVGFRGDGEALEYRGSTKFDGPADGKPPLEIPFFHYGNKQLDGFFSIFRSGQPIDYIVDANLQLLPDGSLLEQTLNGIAGRNIFLSTQTLLDQPELRNVGWLQLVRRSPEVNMVGVLSAGTSKAIVQDTLPLAARNAFPLDGGKDWKGTYSESHLVVNQTDPGTVPMTAILLDENGQTLDMRSFDLVNGLTKIPLSDLADEDGQVATVVMEFPNGGGVTSFAGIFELGEFLDSNLQVLDVIPLQKLSGKPNQSRLGQVYEAWQTNSQSCLGSQLVISDVIEFVNDPNRCF